MAIFVKILVFCNFSKSLFKSKLLQRKRRKSQQSFVRSKTPAFYISEIHGLRLIEKTRDNFKWRLL